MENKSEFFDLKREKRELDAFLSTITEGAEAHLRNGVVQPKEALSALADNPSVPEAVVRESSEIELDMPALELEEASAEPIHREKPFTPDERELVAGVTDSTVVEPEEKPVWEVDTASSLMQSEEEKKSEDLSAIKDAQDTKPAERFETAAPYDETGAYDEPVMSETRQLSDSFTMTARSDETTTADKPLPATMSPPEEEKMPARPAPEKKKSKTSAYDFAPEKKSTAVGKWVWIGILIILLMASLVGYFWFYPERGSKTVELIKSYIPLSKTDQSATPVSVQGVTLTQIRQKLIYNTTLKRNIRVLEGIAENATPHPISRIKIIANLYNAEGVVLASTESFCGNIIIDEKLESLDGNGILSALKDAKTMEDRIPPKGQTPCMIVFTSEPAGVFRLAILPADFKKH